MKTLLLKNRPKTAWFQDLLKITVQYDDSGDPKFYVLTFGLLG
jgi:hypothetical protein